MCIRDRGDNVAAADFSGVRCIDQKLIHTQPSNDRHAHAMQQNLAASFGQIAGEPVGIADGGGRKPVSYTHLDVYKRQEKRKKQKRLDKFRRLDYDAEKLSR